MTRLLSALAVVLIAAAPPARPGEIKHKLNPTPAGLDSAEFDLWIPDTLPADRPVRGILGSSHYHAGASVYETAEWRAIAAKYDFAILRYKITSGGNPIDTSRAGARAILQALTEMAPMARRPEIQHAGIIPTGLSWGAAQVCSYTSFIPERVICAVPFRACGHDVQRAASSDASKRVPLLHLSAGRERFDKYKPHQSQEGHKGLPAKGALSAMIIHPGEEHHILGDLSYLKIWLEEIVPLRVPARIPVGQPYPLLPVTVSGYVGTFEVQTIDKAPWKGGDGMIGPKIAPAARGAISPDAKSWVPSERLAKAWVTYGETGQTGPVAPFAPPGLAGAKR
jgi:hypothetical protein